MHQNKRIYRFSQGALYKAFVRRYVLIRLEKLRWAFKEG